MLIVLAGPSTVGKNFLCDLAIDRGYQFVVPSTTRPRRQGETDGKDYHFVSKEDFENSVRQGLFCEWDYVLGHYYGDSLAAVEFAIHSRNIWFLHAMAKMCVRMKARYGSKLHTVLLRPTNQAALSQRLADRGYRGSELAQRTQHGLDELAHVALMDQVLEDVDQADAELLLNMILAGAQVGVEW